MKKNLYLIIIIIITILSSCSKKPQESDLKNKFISFDKAISIVKENNLLIMKNKNSVKLRTNEFTLLDSFVISDKSNFPAIYVLNYTLDNDTLFSLVYADINIHPIIAHGNGLFKKDKIVEGLNLWVDNAIKTLSFIRENNLTEKQFYEEVLQAMIAPEDPCEGQNWGANVGPLLTTEWGQECFYNAHLDSGCPSNCDHVVTGCVATAIAQVLNFHNSPSNYDWDNMLDNYRDASSTPSSTQINAIATLMDEVGQSVDMDYSCGRSAAAFCEGNITNAILNNFDYSTCSNCADYSPNYSQSIFTNELDNDRPILIWGWGDGGNHAWVCDGYYELHTCYYDKATGEFSGVTFFAYHMNWGWDGDNNGWYDILWGGDWDYLRKYIYNINP